MNLASSEAVVMVTLDPADESSNNQSSQMASATSTEASVIVHNSDNLPLLHLPPKPPSTTPLDSTPSSSTPSDVTSPVPHPPISTSEATPPVDPLSGLLAGVPSPIEELSGSPQEPASPAAEAARGAEAPPPSEVCPLQQLLGSHVRRVMKGEGGAKQSSGGGSNPMSVSVPNLTASMEQTMGSLLESFGAAHVARRNLGNSSNNMARAASNASSLMRLALSSNSPGQSPPLPLSSLRSSLLSLSPSVSFAGSLLSTAQSFPNLTTSGGAVTSTTLTAAHTTGNVTSLSQALTMSLTSTSSDSDNDFLETCRAATLLAELEDDDEHLPDPDDDDDDENDDENEDDEDYDDVMEEDDYENASKGRRRTWDDEFVLKRQFSALIPAFDPRPGRTNVHQTQDFEIPPPGTPKASTAEDKETVPQPKLQLFLKGPGLPGVSSAHLFERPIKI